MKMLVWIIAGALLGMVEGAGGAVAGAVLGGMIASLRKERSGRVEQHEARLLRLEQELAGLRARLADAVPATEPATEPAGTPAPAPEAALAYRPATVGFGPEPGSKALALTAGAVASASLTDPDSTAPADAGAIPAPPPGSARHGTIDLDALYGRCRDWLFGGNTLVRIGILVLFFGLAFLARYAVEHAMLPPQLRLAGIALLGLGLAGLGWRLRHSRPGYGLTLQGGGVAVLYLTTFAAMRLYEVLPPGIAFALLLVIVAFAAVLAVRQNAAALAIIGTAGGFAAPILASTGEGNHVHLFGYYAVLNAGVLALAWRKAWRGLNLTGFVFTFAIGLAWGARYYHPAHFATTEPFLILFFLMYVAAALAYAWKQQGAMRDAVDGTLVFGVPVVAFGLQAALVHDMPDALAWSAAAVGVFYLALAAIVHRARRPGLGVLVSSLVALGVAFLTLAIPLAIDGRWSAAAWALEGAAIWWVGLHQQRRLAAASGLLLQAGAALLFAADLALHGELRHTPVLNSALFGTLMIAAAAFLSAWCAARRPTAGPRLRAIGAALLGWAWLWWLGGAWAEIEAHVTTGYQPAASLLLFALSGALACRLALRLQWSGLHTAAALPLIGMAAALAQTLAYGVPPSLHLGWLAWPLGLALHLSGLRGLDADVRHRALLTLVHAAGVWVLALALSQELGVRAASHALGIGWHTAAYALAPALLLGLVACRGRGAAWPIGGWRSAYLLWAAIPLAAGLALWALLSPGAGNGDAAPLSYVPVLNPLDFTVLLTLAAIGGWMHRADDLLDRALGPPLRRHAALGALAFVCFNAALLRAVHHLGGVAWDVETLFASETTQTTLSLCWAVLGLGLMLLAGRRARRSLWIAGAGLMGAVVIKLFVVDMAASGALARIVSFIGAGLLLLVVGYFSPLPPKAQAASATAPD